ncbi:MAG: Eco57I restriction-modification methylase domain-containing protein [Bacteroidetes bacterium]|nr:Eco57I restriction-modification methylase domain-containing protein [Bacteroidota bacterium]
MTESAYNPDVLSCLANLSNDEVFTPPALANRILDMLPQELFQNPDSTFLDPGCKSGVFLREITKRLMAGLETRMPEVQARANHIFTRQVYGLAITELTGLMSRRSVYAAKTANGPYSYCTAFSDAQGLIQHRRLAHTWKEGRCVFCGASQEAYNREEALETYAYPFIHTHEPEKLFHMKFDVIIGNPPYQLGSDGGTRDIPIYNRFVEQAKKLKPRFLCMIIPSRWMASGLGLSEFRKDMLADRHIRRLVDYPVASEVFPGVEVKGGVCYFLWERDSEGDCAVTSIRGEDVAGPFSRDLREFDVFVRDSRALSILRKVLARKEASITEILSVDKEFGWTSNFDGFHAKQQPGDVPLHYIRSGKRSTGWIAREAVTKSAHLVDTWKLLIPQAGSDGGQRIPDSVLGQSLLVASPSACTQSYLFFFLPSKEEAEHLDSYLRSRFFRFLVSLRKITQHATRSTYTWVPVQDFCQAWSDEKLYAKYGINEAEVAYIESMIREMPPAER